MHPSRGTAGTARGAKTDRSNERLGDATEPIRENPACFTDEHVQFSRRHHNYLDLMAGRFAGHQPCGFFLRNEQSLGKLFS